jgi:hypothetical protein
MGKGSVAPLNFLGQEKSAKTVRIAVNFSIGSGQKASEDVARDGLCKLTELTSFNPLAGSPETAVYAMYSLHSIDVHAVSNAKAHAAKVHTRLALLLALWLNCAVSHSVGQSKKV